MRRFIRHPSDIPISYYLAESTEQSERLRDVSQGGLCFSAEKPIKTGAPIHIEIPLGSLPFEADGTVAWCRSEGDHFAVGVKFTDNATHYSVRMVEQICHIEHYRSEVYENEGRELDSEEAAREWVAKYAAQFPQ